MEPNDITLLAADRLEAALERLALALEARVTIQAQVAVPAPVAELPTDMVPRAQVERISARLDEALARLRMLLGDDAGADV